MDATVDSRSSPAVGELVSARVRYGFALRSGSWSAASPGIEYDGLTPNDLAVGVSAYGRGYVGGALSFQREGLGLFTRDTNAKVISGGLIRGHVGPSGRIAFGPFKIELLAGYSFAQLPLFTQDATTVTFAPTQRHSLMIASRAVLSLPAGLFLEARGEVPIALSVKDGAGNPARSSGFAAGGGLGIALFHVDKARFSALADYQYVSDSLQSSVENGDVASQRLSRVGLNLVFDYLDAPPAPPAPRTGGLLLAVLDAETGKPLADADVELTQDGKAVTLTPAGAGRFRAENLDPGQVVAKASVGGYVPGEAAGSITAGSDLPLELRVKKEPPKLGGLTVTLVDKETGEPVANAEVKIRGETFTSDDAGVVTVEGQRTGPAEISVTAKDYHPVKEVASIVAFKNSPVALQLNKSVKRIPATLTGLVRSARGGKPIAADLEIPQAKIKTKANASGAFTFRVEGGTYNVIISARGYLTQQKTVTVRDGDQAIFNVDLYPSNR